MDFFSKRQREKAVYFTSDNIKVPHAFSTRLGGVSIPAHLKELNLDFQCGDDVAAVETNIRIFEEYGGFLPGSLVRCHQIHSNHISYVTEKDIGRILENTDGLITDCSGVTLCVKVADCIPVLFWDETGQVIGAVHSGWRGTVSGISRVCVEKMRALGAGKIHAAIGPSIKHCCYEVKDDFIAQVTEMAGTSYCKKYILERDGKKFADINRMLYDSLLESGIEKSEISNSVECTCCRPDLFFSHRASGGKRGLMYAAIMKP